MLEIPMMTISPPTKSMMETDGSSDPSTISDLSSSSDGASFPLVKRARLDDLKSADEIDFSKLTEDEYLDLWLSSCESCMAAPGYTSKAVDTPTQARMYAELALAYYKEKTGKDYEYTRYWSMCPVPSPIGPGVYLGTHLNFYARLRSSESNPETFFYAKLDDTKSLNEVVDCYMFPLATDYGIDLIVHPPDVECPGCPTFVGLDPNRWEMVDAE